MDAGQNNYIIVACLKPKGDIPRGIPKYKVVQKRKFKLKIVTYIFFCNKLFLIIDFQILK